MIQSSVVFLIDINAIPPKDPSFDDGKKEIDNLDDSGPHKLQNDSLEIFPFREDEELKALDETLVWLKDFILVTLFREANSRSDYEFEKVQWSFKFFDSSRHVDHRDGRAFVPFDYDSFNNFEKQLDQKMGSRSARTDSQYEVLKAKYLSDAIKIITGSLNWTESQSLNTSRSLNSDEITVRNMVYAITRVPRTEKELATFADLHSISSTKDFMGVLLPLAFSHRFHHQFKIQLNFVDMWTAPENAGHSYLPNWTGEYPRQIGRCLQYLGNGRVLKVPDMSVLYTGPLGFGLIPYPISLRLRLKQASVRNENIPSHIQRLAPVGSKNSIKISPDFDTASVSRSMKSSQSILEASINIHHQSKILRPFQMSSAYESNDNHPDLYRHTSDRRGDRLREGERKRKRFEYDSSDYHMNMMHNRRRKGLYEDTIDMNDSEVDSQCDREQRLESWINDGVFSSKRKRHLDATTTSVPMSRPVLSRSTHVFHEPAPKLPGSRGKKMLATVERQKLKVSAVETKRRSAEGVDIKRITQKQEKELSAIKRRLKTYMEGELEEDEDNPAAWLEKFRDELRKFADMILQEENPCLVALAQALVNSASVKFTQQRLLSLRSAFRKKDLTAKDLLESILLIEFTELNKNIINAHEPSPGGNGKQKVQKVIAFREAELQIILRMEIAWCFVEPDSDERATQELLTEIVRVLKIINAYRTQPPIEHFINKVLLPTYSQCNRFMKGLYRTMSIPLPIELMDGSPLPSSSRRDDDSSIISSTSSANLYPEDSASQLQTHKRQRYRPSPTIRRPTTTHRHSGKKAGSGSKRVKRQILVANSNPKLLSSSQFLTNKLDGQRKSTQGGVQKNSPKRVRRNLFDVKTIDKKDSKTLIALSNSAKLTKSSAFKSPKGKSSLSSPSGFFRAVRSRKQLGFNGPSDSHYASPTLNSDVLCPESPATPNCDKRSVGSRYAATVTSTGSGELQRVIQESPEVVKNEFESRQMNKVSSLSFYSSFSGHKSRAWEKSENQLMAARIKDSVDLRSRELRLSDLEILHSPEPKYLPASTDTPGTNVSITEDSFVETRASPLIAHSQSLLELTGPAPDLNNPSIEALIRSETFPIQASAQDLSVKPKKSESAEGSPSLHAGASPSSLQTPSKRVQFNLNGNSVTTPVSARRSNSGTPKSILKESHE